MDVKSVLITGTTSGLGRGLLHHYVERAAKVVAVNRRRDPELEARYPSVRFECVDVRSADTVDNLVRQLAASNELPDVFILNAGIDRLDNDEAFDLPLYREVLDTNLYGALNFIAPLTRVPAAGVERHIVAISSMVNYAANPYGLGYHASKKALTACFDVWARMYAETDLVFKQVMLGPVHTGIYTMADRLPGWTMGSRAWPPHRWTTRSAQFQASRPPARESSSTPGGRSRPSARCGSVSDSFPGFSRGARRWTENHGAANRARTGTRRDREAAAGR